MFTAKLTRVAYSQTRQTETDALFRRSVASKLEMSKMPYCPTDPALSNQINRLPLKFDSVGITSFVPQERYRSYFQVSKFNIIIPSHFV
jgi:hypothetical protein